MAAPSLILSCQISQSWAVSRYTLKAYGTLCVTTFGTRRKHRWCVGSWAAGQPSPPRERPTMARAQAPSFWTMCSARGLRPIWGSAPTPAGSSTTVSMGKTPVSPAWVNAFLSSLGLELPFPPLSHVLSIFPTQPDTLIFFFFKDCMID